MRVLNESGYAYLESQSKRNRNLGIIFLVVSIPAFIFAHVGGWLVGILFLGLGFRYVKNSFAFKSGIRGEQAVVSELNVLGDSYYMVNDVMTGDTGGNIDHVVVGPNGVFAIETKNNTGRVRCNGDYWSKKGQRRWYDIRSVSKQANINAIRVKRLIQGRTNWNGFFHAVCVFTDPAVILSLNRPTVTVLPLYGLVNYIREYRTSSVMKDEQVNAVARCILSSCSEDNG